MEHFHQGVVHRDADDVRLEGPLAGEASVTLLGCLEVLRDEVEDDSVVSGPEID